MLITCPKVTLPDVIEQTGSVFVLDNILIAYKYIRRIKRETSKNGLCVVKLDLDKAYVRLEWCFLRRMMD